MIFGKVNLISIFITMCLTAKDVAASSVRYLDCSKEIVEHFGDCRKDTSSIFNKAGGASLCAYHAWENLIYDELSGYSREYFDYLYTFIGKGKAHKPYNYCKKYAGIKVHDHFQIAPSASTKDQDKLLTICMADLEIGGFTSLYEPSDITQTKLSKAFEHAYYRTRLNEYPPESLQRRYYKYLQREADFTELEKQKTPMEFCKGCEEELNHVVNLTCTEPTEFADFFLKNFRCEKLKGLPRRYADYLFSHIRPGSIKTPGKYCKYLIENKYNTQACLENLAKFKFKQYDTARITLAYAYYNTGLRYLPSGSFAQNYFKHIMEEANTKDLKRAAALTKFCEGIDKTLHIKSPVIGGTVITQGYVPAKPDGTRDNTNTGNKNDDTKADD